jgi:2-polyprenyl-3-methyl-5-hydroxy-6-metoxy-1,4-benzoquinol methylase
MMAVPLSLMNKRRYVAQRLVLSRDLALEGEVKKLLDVGCGDGILLSMISDDIEKHAVDVLEHFSENSGCVRYLKHDVSRGIPYPDETFDVVHSSELIEHLIDTEFFLRECRRVLKIGGKLVISTPNLHYWRNIVEWIRGNQFFFVDYHAVQEGHVRYFCPKTLSTLAHGARFRNIRTKTIGDWGSGNVFLKIVARLFQAFSTTKNLILFLVATK